MTVKLRSRPELLIRFMVGLVFLSEGIQKFLFPAEVGSGRFERLNLPFPDILGPFVGLNETVCGFLILIGWRLKWTVLPLLIVIAVAILTTKTPILINQGFWKMAHESRTDFSMVMGLLFLLITHLKAPQ